MRRLLSLLGCIAVGYLLALAGSAATDGVAQTEGPPPAQGRLVDLTHPFNEKTIYWPTAKTFTLTEVFEGETEGGWHYAANNFEAAEHGGTHLDAPIHFARNRSAADEIPLSRLVGEAVVVDVSRQARRNPDYLVSARDLRASERRDGAIPRGSIVLLRTGWGRHWPNAERYLGTAERGEQAVPKLHFPGLGPSGARWLVRRRVKAVGIDTASIDRGQSTTFLSHRVLGAANVPVFENIANAQRLPMRGLTVVALPMKIDGGSGGPLRAIAILGR